MQPSVMNIPNQQQQQQQPQQSLLGLLYNEDDL